MQFLFALLPFSPCDTSEERHRQTIEITQSSEEQAMGDESFLLLLPIRPLAHVLSPI